MYCLDRMNFLLKTDPNRTANTPTGNGSKEKTPKKWWRKCGDWLTYKDKHQWLQDMRGSLSMTASIIATITFQSALNPPDGVLQAGVKDDINCPNGDSSHPCPGQAVLAVMYQDYYMGFMVCNTICFIASLSVCLLLVSGLPLNHRLPTWLLAIGMCITITSLSLTYLFGATMVTPDTIWDSVTSVFGIVILVWIALSVIIGVLLMIRFIARGVIIIRNIRRRKSRKDQQNSINRA